MLRLTASEGRTRPRVARAAPTAPPAAPSYARHVPERMLLYALVQAHYPDLLARLASEDRSLPEYVREEFDAYLRCGVLDHGFLRKAPRDDLGATPQARVWHRRDHLHLLQRHGADNRQHRGAHSHPANPRPLRKTRRAGASALPAGSARTARCGRVTPRRPHSPRRDRNPPRKVFEFPIRNANDWLTWEILRVQAFQRFTAERATPFSELTKR